MIVDIGGGGGGVAVDVEEGGVLFLGGQESSIFEILFKDYIRNFIKFYGVNELVVFGCSDWQFGGYRGSFFSFEVLLKRYMSRFVRLG